MKIIIVGENSVVQMLGACPVINCVKHIKHLIQTNPHEDIEGEIHPSARENRAELRDILQEIYVHKKKLWYTRIYNSGGKIPIDPPFHEHFIAVIKQKIPELFNDKFSL